MSLPLLRPALLVATLLFVSASAAFAEWRPVEIPAKAGAATPSGPAWYRCYIRVPDNMTVAAQKDLWRDSIMLQLGGIRGEVAVFLNGQKIADAKDLPTDRRRRL